MKDYVVRLFREGCMVSETAISGNYQRLNVINLPTPVEADAVEIRVTATNGAPDARIFEIRVYAASSLS